MSVVIVFAQRLWTFIRLPELSCFHVATWRLLSGLGLLSWTRDTVLSLAWSRPGLGTWLSRRCLGLGFTLTVLVPSLPFVLVLICDQFVITFSLHPPKSDLTDHISVAACKTSC